jgi:hypothetical protein
VEEFGASGLAWRRIVEGIIVEKSWKRLVNAAPAFLDFQESGISHNQIFQFSNIEWKATYV